MAAEIWNVLAHNPKESVMTAWFMRMKELTLKEIWREGITATLKAAMREREGSIVLFSLLACLAAE
jgi:hypothetical protein